MRLELDSCYIINTLSIVVTATIPGINFVVSGGDNVRSMKVLSEGFAKFGQSEIHLITKDKEVSIIMLKTLFRWKLNACLVLHHLPPPPLFFLQIQKDPCLKQKKIISNLVFDK